MLDLAGRLAAAGVRCVLPAAAGNTWYPQRFTAPLAENEPWLTYALEALDAHVDGDSALIGFSQGACLVLEYVARHPAPLPRRGRADGRPDRRRRRAHAARRASTARRC